MNDTYLLASLITIGLNIVSYYYGRKVERKETHEILTDITANLVIEKLNQGVLIGVATERKYPNYLELNDKQKELIKTAPKPPKHLLKFINVELREGLEND